MATVNLTNIQPQPALRWQGVPVTLSGAQSVTWLPLLAIGMKCQVSSSSKVGYISSIDLYGHSFEVTPDMPVNRFESDTPGYLKNNELIIVTLS